MPRFRFRIVVVVGMALASLLAVPSASWAGGPGKWTQLAAPNNGADTFGMLRTSNGDLHLAWWKQTSTNQTNCPNKYGIGTSTISLAGKLLATGTAISGWCSVETDPQLVKDGAGLRVIFEGYAITANPCYKNGAVFTATSTNGTGWNLVNGSMSFHTAGVGNLAATTESDGVTPVATFASGALYHVNVDPNCPASSLDGTVPIDSGNSPNNPAIVTASDHSVWVASFQSITSTGYGYFVTQILPTAGPSMEAPGSHAPPSQNNQPLEPVALAARVGGGVYMAYCVANSSQPCVHIDLWKVGSSKPMIVPGSQNTHSARVALAAAPGGRLALAWYNAPSFDNAKGVIHAARTNTSATAFGVVRTIKPPAHFLGLSDLQAQASTGRIDVAINANIQAKTSVWELFQTQILPGLSLHANPSSFSHRKAATVTFTVADAGQPVSGAKVSCLGKAGTTTGTGQVKLNFSKGTATGNHVCTATKAGYSPGHTTLRVT